MSQTLKTLLRPVALWNPVKELKDFLHPDPSLISGSWVESGEGIERLGT